MAVVQTAYLIDEELKRKFKTVCARRGVTMSEQITKYIRDFVDNDNLGNLIEETQSETNSDEINAE